jgi:hypothetical protein
VDHGRRDRERHGCPAGHPGHRYGQGTGQRQRNPHQGEHHDPVTGMLRDGVPDRVKRASADDDRDDQAGEMWLGRHAPTTGMGAPPRARRERDPRTDGSFCLSRDIRARR